VTWVQYGDPSSATASINLIALLNLSTTVGIDPLGGQLKALATNREDNNGISTAFVSSLSEKL
jgi:hypothetical protein